MRIRHNRASHLLADVGGAGIVMMLLLASWDLFTIPRQVQRRETIIRAELIEKLSQVDVAR